MLSKQDFVAAIECIRNHDKLQNNLNDVLKAIDTTSQGFVFLYETYNTLVIKLLKSSLGISQENDWIEFALKYGIHRKKVSREKRDYMLSFAKKEAGREKRYFLQILLPYPA